MRGCHAVACLLHRPAISTGQSLFLPSYFNDKYAISLLIYLPQFEVIAAYGDAVYIVVH